MGTGKGPLSRGEGKKLWRYSSAKTLVAGKSLSNTPYRGSDSVSHDPEKPEYCPDWISSKNIPEYHPDPQSGSGNDLIFRGLMTLDLPVFFRCSLSHARPVHAYRMSMRGIFLRCQFLFRRVSKMVLFVSIQSFYPTPICLVLIPLHAFLQ
jgi:hypothetical protein